MTDKPHVMIAGAGIGGLTAALALLQRGFEVDVYEAAPELGEIGAGVQVSANGTRVLYHLGLGEAIERVGWPPTGKDIRIWNTGQTWPLFDLGTQSIEHYGYPYFMFHRADLHAVLVDAVLAARPGCIHLDSRVADMAQDGGDVVLRLDGGGSARGDVLIGADGIHSAVRAALFGPDRPKFTGCMAWRGIIDVARLPDGLVPPVGSLWVGPGGHVVHYHVRGGALVNFVGVRERDDWRIESYTAEGTVEECLADYAGWHDTIQILIRHIERPMKWALMDREPLARCTLGRVTLLGDACHPMLPFLAQGAVMAIEDGLIIARCLDAHDDPEVALLRYQEARLERCTKTVHGSTENMKRIHNQTLADPEVARKFADAQWDTESVKQRYDWLFTYDATSVPV